MFAIAARRLMLADKDFLPAGIEQFTSVKSFYLRVAKPNLDMINGLPLAFPMITVLELSQVVFQSFDQMIQLICAFPHLETLTHSMCTWNQELEQPPAHLSLSPRLHTMNILSLRLHVFLDWFNRQESMPPISTLRLYGVAEPHMASVASAIERLNTALENLTLDLWDHNHAGLTTLLL